MEQTITQARPIYNLTETQKAARMNCSVSFLQKDRTKAEPVVPFKRYGRMIRYSAED